MGLIIKTILIVFVIGLAAVVHRLRHMSDPLPAPQLDTKAYWGPGSGDKYKEDVTIKKFDITTKPEVIEDLIAQLSRPLKLHDPLEGIGFEYGFNTKYLEKVVRYWRDMYLPKWNEREAYLKKFPHFQTQIQGLNIHFIHVKPTNTEGKKVLPLLLLHGWPGSVREFYCIIPILTTPNDETDYVFEVIAPSLPGYGWSQAASKTKFGPAQMAVVLRNLMLRLRLDKFLVQGGDWGSVIGADIAVLFPQNVIGFHTNFCTNLSPLNQLRKILINIIPGFYDDKEHKEFYKPLPQLFQYLIEETGHFHIQGTKPDTIGTALSHNPVGLAAYILEKFSTWTNPSYKYLHDGGLTKRYTLDALLDNVMIYYVTNSITTSQRLYAEASSGFDHSEMDRVPIRMPAGCARFKHELMHTPDRQLKDKYVNLVHSSHYDDGGHFPAMEKPQTLYDDFVQFVHKALNSSF